MTNPTSEAVAYRATCLNFLLQRWDLETQLMDDHSKSAAMGGEWRDIARCIDQLGLDIHLSGGEKVLLGKTLGGWQLQAIIDTSWRLEALGVLLWALKYLARIPPYDTSYSTEALLDVVDAHDVRAEVSERKVQLREAVEITREREVAELWHWRARSTQILSVMKQQDEMEKIKEAIKQSTIHCENEHLIPTPIRGDFPAFGKAYSELTDEEWRQLNSISHERHFTLNWLCGYSQDWDETPTDT